MKELDTVKADCAERERLHQLLLKVTLEFVCNGLSLCVTGL